MGKHATSPWTDAADEILRRGLADGLSFGQVAQLLPYPITRNAAISRASKLGLKSHNERGARPSLPTSGMSRKARAPKPAPAAVAPVDPPAALPKVVEFPAPAASAVPATARPWIQRGHDECRWPVGAASEMLSCCAPVARGGYCAEHAAIAYRPAPPMRNLKRLAALR